MPVKRIYLSPCGAPRICTEHTLSIPARLLSKSRVSVVTNHHKAFDGNCRAEFNNDTEISLWKVQYFGALTAN
jgi:hypothetical protein